MSPRKPLKDMSNGPTPASDTDEFIEQSKRLVRDIQVENNSLRAKVGELELVNERLVQRGQHDGAHALGTVAGDIVGELQSELQRLGRENHRLQGLLQQSRRQTTELLLSPHTQRHTGTANTNSNAIIDGRDKDAELDRLSEELAWHAKLHLLAEKERLRLLDLLEFAGTEGKVVGREYGVLREKLSRISLADQHNSVSERASVVSDGSSGKCLL